MKRNAILLQEAYRRDGHADFIKRASEVCGRKYERTTHVIRRNVKLLGRTTAHAGRMKTIRLAGIHSYIRHRREDDRWLSEKTADQD